MKKIIPFKNDFKFKTNISEVTSISLEHTMSISDNILSGEFIINGEYKVSDKSINVEPFSLNLPFEYKLEEYDTSQALINIDDFYYEIVDNSILAISISLLVDKLQDKPLIENEISEVTLVREAILDDEEEIKVSKNQENIDILDNTFFDNVVSEENFVSYNVCIIREGYNIENIIEDYNTNMEDLCKYNDMSNLKIGDKIIIPANYERD